MGGFDHAFGVGHHAEHIARVVEDAGDVAGRSVDAFRIAQRDAAFAFQPVERGVVGAIIAVMMGDGEGDAFARLIAAGEGALRIFDRQRDVAADEMAARVAQQRAGQKAAFGQHLKAVADAQHKCATVGCLRHRLHHRRARGHGARAQIVAIGKAAGHADQVDVVRQFRVAMPDHGGPGPGRGFERHRQVAVAIAAGKDDDGALHGGHISLGDLFDAVIFDHRVGQQLAAHGVDILIAGAVGQV
jgi:hypothetical protein